MQRKITDPWTVSPTRILHKHEETEGVTTYQLDFLRSRDRDAYQAKPGQFNMVYLPGVGESAISLSRLYSASDVLVHTVRAVGNVTKGLARLSINQTLGIRGPFGSCWPVKQAIGQHLIVVAGGIGMAPLRPVLETIIQDRSQYDEVSLIVGARTPGERLYSSEYINWRTHGINVLSTVDRATGKWAGRVGFVNVFLTRAMIIQPQKTLLFICGPEAMMKHVIRSARQLRVPRENFWLSIERNMNCAFGHCGHCQFGPHFICKDGPVFQYSRVNRLLRTQEL